MKNVTTEVREGRPNRRPGNLEKTAPLNRRGFLKTALQAGAILAAPQVIPGSVLGKDGGVAPSERIVMGAIGIGNRGSYDRSRAPLAPLTK